MKSVTIHYAKSHFSGLIQQVAAGEEIVIVRAGTPLAKLVPYVQPREPRTPGCWRGKIRIANYFDELPDDSAPFDT